MTHRTCEDALGVSEIGGTHVSIEELLSECLDALSPGGKGRDEHRRLIGLALSRQSIPERTRSALVQLDERFRLHQQDHPWAMFQTREEAGAFRRRIDEGLAARVLPQYVYHGTTVGHLESILALGLIPGKNPIWTGQSEEAIQIREHSNGSVFFSDSWRGAMYTWAFVAHKRTRGPKTSRKRLPAVIRLDSRNLSLEADALAAARSWKVSRPVPTLDAEVIIGFDIGFPCWVPLRLAVSSMSGPSTIGIRDSAA
jgi:hypothetical protein